MTTRRLLLIVLYGLSLLLPLLQAPSAYATTSGLQASADAIVEAQGRVTSVTLGAGGTVYLFEENHSSKVGQVEIARMLLRLHKNQGLRTVGLEGYVESRPLKAPWAEKMDAATRLRVGARLLGDGEISSAEFLCVAFDDVSVVGIDDPTQYAVSPDRAAGAAPTMYLVLIAEHGMTEKNKQRLEELLSAKSPDALSFTVNSDPWTKGEYATRRRTDIRSTAQELEGLARLEAEAKRRGVDIPPELASGMQLLKRFYSASETRSEVMIRKLSELSKQSSPIAGVIGAAHTTRIVEGLRANGISVAVIRANALDNRKTQELSQEEYLGYERKLERRSVESEGLGALVQKKRKPAPVLELPWVKRKVNVYQATVAVTTSVLVSNDKPPYRIGALPPGISVDPDKISRIGDEVLFSIGIEDEKGGKSTIWVRAGYARSTVDRDRSRADIDGRIQSLLAEGGDGGGIEPPKKPRAAGAGAEEPPGGGKPKSPREGAKKVAPGVYARFAESAEALQKESVLETSSS